MSALARRAPQALLPTSGLTSADQKIRPTHRFCFSTISHALIMPSRVSQAVRIYPPGRSTSGTEAQLHSPAAAHGGFQPSSTFWPGSVRIRGPRQYCTSTSLLIPHRPGRPDRSAKLSLTTPHHDSCYATMIPYTGWYSKELSNPWESLHYERRIDHLGRIPMSNV